MDDYAIVIGISQYPGLNQTSRTSYDLLGPDRDADAIGDWLLSPSGGNLKRPNVKVIKSGGFPAAAEPWEAQPAQGEIRKAFLQLCNKGLDPNGSLPMGRRLYVYGSGHGFQQSTNRPALLTAEAIPESAVELVRARVD